MLVYRQAEQFYSKLWTEVNVSHFAHTLYLFNAILITAIISLNRRTKLMFIIGLQVFSVKYEQDFKCCMLSFG